MTYINMHRAAAEAFRINQKKALESSDPINASFEETKAYAKAVEYSIHVLISFFKAVFSKDQANELIDALIEDINKRRPK